MESTPETEQVPQGSSPEARLADDSGAYTGVEAGGEPGTQAGWLSRDRVGADTWNTVPALGAG